MISSCSPLSRSYVSNNRANDYLDNSMYVEAKNQYEIALTEAQKSGNDEAQSVALYGLGRANGYLGNYSQSEKCFLESIRLRMRANAEASSTGYITQNRLELARLYIAQRKWTMANSQFNQAVPELERVGILSSDPIAYANTLRIYEASLSKSGDTSKASSIRSKIDKIQKDNPGRTAIYYNKPYPRA